MKLLSFYPDDHSVETCLRKASIPCFRLTLALAFASFAAAQPLQTRVVPQPNAGAGVTREAGRVQIDVRENGEWHEQTLLSSPSPMPFGHFGAAYALSGDSLLVGEVPEGLPARSGNVWVYRRASGSWILQSQLQSPRPVPGDRFGSLIGWLGDRVEIGAAKEHYAFEQRSGVWTVLEAASRPKASGSENGKLRLSGLELVSSIPSARFGEAVTLTAMVSPASASGNVAFYADAHFLGSAPVASGRATLTTAPLSAGTSALRSIFSGDGTFARAESASLEQTTRAGAGSGFVLSQTQHAGTNISGVVMGDFNGDGRVDIALSSQTGVSVLLGNGNGTFQQAVDYLTSAGADQVVTGDFNGDGKPDLAIVSRNAGSVGILLGNGDGTFQPPTWSAADSDASSLVVVDFNGDGKADLAVANATYDSIGILLGNGDGSFAEPLVFATPLNPHALAVGDFNNDGIADLAVATAQGIGVLAGKGDGTFATPSVHAASAVDALVVADFNGDGVPDLAFNGGVLLGRGDGTFGSVLPLVTNGNSHSLATGDFNGDGITDLAIGSEAGFGVFLGSGDGTFQSGRTYAGDSAGLALAIGDFNGDSVADLAVIGTNPLRTSDVSILLGASLVQIENKLVDSQASRLRQPRRLAPLTAPPAVSTTLSYTGGLQTFVVPPRRNDVDHNGPRGSRRSGLACGL